MAGRRPISGAETGVATLVSVANEPREQEFYRGVASVPPRPAPALPDTGSFPPIESPPSTLTDGQPEPVRPAVRRRPPEPPPGLIVRRRWRRLRAGAPWTWSGLLTLLFCWGIWAVSLRGNDLLGPVIALIVVLAVAGFVFVLSRLIGRAVLEQTMGRERPSAWPSHLTVCVFLVFASIGFLQRTEWLVDSWRWFGDAWQGLVDIWPL